MNGYTIENSIDLLEKDVKALKQGGGGGGASNWNQLQGKPFDTLGEEFHNLDGALTIQDISSDKIALPDSEHYNWENVSEAVESMNEELGHINGDIIDLTTEVNSLDESKQDTLTPGVNIDIVNNVIGVKNIYDNTERVIGKWFDKDLYRNIIKCTYNSRLDTSTWTNILSNVGNISLVDFKIKRNDNGGLVNGLFPRVNNGNLEVYNYFNQSLSNTAFYNSDIIIEYTKEE